jgi:hypothetical protein
VNVEQPPLSSESAGTGGHGHTAPPGPAVPAHLVFRHRQVHRRRRLRRTDPRLLPSTPCAPNTRACPCTCGPCLL